MKIGEYIKSNKVSSIFFWIGAIFCFVFFPVFLLNIGLDSYINTKNEVEKREAYRKLEIDLEKVLQYADGKHYYHSLLKKIFDIAISQNNPIEYLKIEIPHLKKRNPNVYSFVVWDNEKNKIIESLSDIKSHKYVLNTLNDVFNLISKENNINYPTNPSSVKDISKRFNIIRSFLGNFLAIEGLLNPLLKANLGKIVPSSENPKKSYFWFQSNEKITLLATINKDSLASFAYIEKLIKALNKISNDEIKYGMIDLLHNKSIIEEKDEVNEAELNLALAKYDNYSNLKLTSNNYLILIKILNPFVRVFTYIKKDTVFNYQNIRDNSLIIVLCIIAVFFGTIWIGYKYTKLNFSISWKLSLLFLYANGLPLIALGFIGYDYLEQNKNIQLEEVYGDISQFINDFDSQFGLIKNQYSKKFDTIIDNINSNISIGKKNDDLYKELMLEANKSSCEEFCIIDKHSNIVLSSNKALNNNIMKNVGQNILKYINNTKYTPLATFHKENNSSKKNNLFNLYDSSIFLDFILSQKSNIIQEQIFDSANYYYINFIGDYKNRNFESVVVITWQTNQLQENYLKNYIEKANNNKRNFSLIAFSGKYGKSYPNNLDSQKDLLNKFRQIINLNSLNFKNLNYKGNNYAAFGTVGHELNEIAILGLFPLEIINNKINNIKLRFIIFSFISVFLTLGVSWILSVKFITPINDLSVGIKAMGKQNFAYRIPIKSGDEFGLLSTTFNNTLESLENLAVATTVQENLFPLKALKHNNALIWGKSVTMTRLGGDYFDYFSLNKDLVGILMGDVAGHGVPAGFLMAMAKAAVLLTEEDKNNPSKLLSAIHKVFYHVKSKKIKRMMTCVYFCINTHDGSFVMSNAGHCYPALINKEGKVSFLEIDGTPLGITKRAKYINIDGQLEDNSYLLLYTDGMLEAHNKEGESIGIQRFSELVSKSYSDDIETFYNNLFSGYKNWASIADDDITMVLVKFGEKNKIENSSLKDRKEVE